MVTNEEREKLEQQFINESRPEDSEIKKSIKRIQEMKTTLSNISNSYESMERQLHEERFRLDELKKIK